MLSASRVTTIQPARAIEGGRITIHGSGFETDQPQLPDVRIGNQPARVVYASPTRLSVIVPAGIADRGRTAVRIGGVADESAFIDIAGPLATGLHQVDNPVFDQSGNLYVTYSGTRGQQVPVSIFRVRPNGTRETFSSGIVNPDVDGDRSVGPPVRLQPVRRHGLSSQRRRIGGNVRDRFGRGVRAGVRSRWEPVRR